MNQANPKTWCEAIPVFGPVASVALSFGLEATPGTRIGINLSPSEARDFARAMLRAADLVDDPARAKKGGES